MAPFVNSVSVLRSVILCGVIAATGCAGPQAEVIARTLVDRQTEDTGCREGVISAQVDLSWPTTTVRFYRSTRCQRTAVDRWKTEKRNPASGTAKVVTGLVGAIIGAGGTYLIAANSNDFKPASLSNPAGVSALGSIAGIGIAVGGSVAGGLIGQGLLAIHDKLGESSEYDFVSTNLGEIDRDSHPADGNFSGHPTVKAMVVLRGDEVLGLNLGALSFDGKEIEFEPSQRELLFAAQSCARTLGVAAPKLRDAKECFEAGVAQAEPIYARLTAELAPPTTIDPR